ncbi:helix-turn-helix domain-containing protein [Jeotgalibaca caeni]|uniref:helix-turn-helix domain-containing protein n=1 Tax=Jeotgalibaca caeni TaxID=3028623 RepID=UPI00237EBE85|nr:RodZ domain-containing protein [Jeotgalibaca caeni]MDE1548957.1 DUF4115 domain-containing protein [Jeotgalibaca caeni]
MEENKYIGERLKEARIKKGYTLDDLQQLTKIQKRYLIAIEENHLEELPGDFFVKAFIRQYAEAVDVTEEETKTMTKELPTINEAPVPVGDQAPSRAALKRSSKETKFRYSSNSQSSLPTFLMVLFFILILGMIWFYFNFIRAEDPTSITNNPSQPSIIISSQEETSDEQESETEESSESEETNAPSITGGESADGLVPYTLSGIDVPTTLTLNVNESGRSWMQVQINEAVVFEGTIEPGMSQEIEVPANTEEISIRVGYIPSTTIVFGDDLTVPNPENGQEVQTQTYLFNIEP